MENSVESEVQSSLYIIKQLVGPFKLHSSLTLFFLGYFLYFLFSLETGGRGGCSSSLKGKSHSWGCMTASIELKII